jgi:excisionase family DNA binding protein
MRRVPKPTPGAASGSPDGSPTSSSLSTALSDPLSLPYLITVDETASLLRTTRKAIYAMAERGLLPGALRLGRRLLVRRDELLRVVHRTRPGGIAPFTHLK